MNGILRYILGCQLLFFCPTCVWSQPAKSGTFSIALHGGAGIEPEKLSESAQQAHREALRAR